MPDKPNLYSHVYTALSTAAAGRPPQEVQEGRTAGEQSGRERKPSGTPKRKRARQKNVSTGRSVVRVKRERVSSDEEDCQPPQRKRPRRTCRELTDSRTHPEVGCCEESSVKLDTSSAERYTDTSSWSDSDNASD